MDVLCECIDTEIFGGPEELPLTQRSSDIRSHHDKNHYITS